MPTTRATGKNRATNGRNRRFITACDLAGRTDRRNAALITYPLASRNLHVELRSPAFSSPSSEVTPRSDRIDPRQPPTLPLQTRRVSHTANAVALLQTFHDIHGSFTANLTVEPPTHIHQAQQATKAERPHNNTHSAETRTHSECRGYSTQSAETRTHSEFREHRHAACRYAYAQRIWRPQHAECQSGRIQQSCLVRVC